MAVSVECLRDLDRMSQIIVYKSLLKSVRDCTGEGFCNHDQMHFIYVIGCSQDKCSQDDDSPEKNELYQMMRVLSEVLKDSQDIAPNDFVTDWQSFCKMAVDACKNNGKGNEG